MKVSEHIEEIDVLLKESVACLGGFFLIYLKILYCTLKDPHYMKCQYLWYVFKKKRRL